MRLALLLFLISFCAFAQDKNPWNGKKCAVVLTYDDALNVHLDNVIPALDSLNLKGTFYLSGYFPGCRNRLSDWSKAAKGGHELANHTLFHPCTGKIPGRDWVKPDYDLGSYTMQRLLDEVRMTNVFSNPWMERRHELLHTLAGIQKLEMTLTLIKSKTILSQRGVSKVRWPRLITSICSTCLLMVLMANQANSLLLW